MIRRHVPHAAIALALAAGAAGALGTAAAADGGGCGGGAGWTVVGDVPADTSSVTVSAPAGTGIVETCVWNGVETELYAYDPAATSVVIAPLGTPTIVEYGYRLIALEPAPSPDPAPEPQPAPEPTTAPAPAPQPAAPPAPAPARPATSSADPVAPAAPEAAPIAPTAPAAQEPAPAAPVTAPADDECPGLTSHAACARVLVLASTAPSPTTAIGPSASMRGPATPDLADPADAGAAAAFGALVLLAGSATAVVMRRRPVAPPTGRAGERLSSPASA